MHSKSDNKEIMNGNETDGIILRTFLFCFTKISKRARRINER